MRPKVFTILAILSSSLIAAVAFAQKAPPGDVGSSAPELSFLLLTAGAIIPSWLLLRRPD